MKDKIKAFIKQTMEEKRLFLIVVCGLSGIALLVAGEVFVDKTEGEASSDNSVSTSFSVSDYEIELETRLTEIIETIDGAGKVKVMLTIDCSDENVYATENKSDSDSEERNYVVVETDGNDSGILLKVSMPEIRGVAVVCHGADSAKVREEITGVLTAVLGISTNRVNISKMKNTSGG